MNAKINKYLHCANIVEARLIVITFNTEYLLDIILGLVKPFTVQIGWIHLDSRVTPFGGKFNFDQLRLAMRYFDFQS
jgi:hypothetical protein